MDLFKLITKVGGRFLKDAIPPPISNVIGIVESVNEFLSDDDKLDENSTGSDIGNALNKMPAEDRAAVMSKEFDVEIVKEQEHTKRFEAMARVDASGHTTRPKISLLFAWNLVLTSDALIGAICYGIIKNQITLDTAWPAFVAILAPFAVVVKAYFGLRTAEKQQKYEMGSGVKSSPVGLLGALAKKLTG